MVPCERCGPLPPDDPRALVADVHADALRVMHSTLSQGLDAARTGELWEAQEAIESAIEGIEGIASDASLYGYVTEGR